VSHTVPDRHRCDRRRCRALNEGDSTAWWQSAAQLDRTAKGMSVLFANGADARLQVPADSQSSARRSSDPDHRRHGSEVTRFTVITDTETDEKMRRGGSPAARRRDLDFELTLTMPLRLTARYRHRSLTHAIEAYVSRRATPTPTVWQRMRWGDRAQHRAACAEPDNRPAPSDDARRDHRRDGVSNASVGWCMG